jgi:hypothetical protein
MVTLKKPAATADHHNYYFFFFFCGAIAQIGQSASF